MRKYTKRKIFKTNFFSKGGEFALPDGTDYTGLYWMNEQKGHFFSGKGPKDKTAKRIYPYAENPQVPAHHELNIPAFQYEKINSKFKAKRNLASPITYVPTPTDKDYSNTFFSRFFVKKVNTHEITEVSEKQHKKIKTQVFYAGYELEWKLMGPEKDVYDSDGVLQAYGVFDTNQRTINKSELEFKGIRDYVTSYTRFAIIT